MSEAVVKMTKQKQPNHKGKVNSTKEKKKKPGTFSHYSEAEKGNFGMKKFGTSLRTNEYGV